ncbi:hypothetical protein HDU92_009101 [Lobulomyces angularis]|nr:hypothetical protein HDU92_009101 [Lobulomyces angularis]
MELKSLIEETSQFSLKAKDFFIAWHGVLTLAFTGFPNSVETLKSKLTKAKIIPTPENFGSRWPKLTLGSQMLNFSLLNSYLHLGALKDEKTLCLKELNTLKEICLKFQLIRNESIKKVVKLSYVFFRNRSLEDIIFQVDMSLDHSFTTKDVEISESQSQVVNNILAEMEDSEIYLKEVEKFGNRISHYRSLHIETTLVAFIDELVLKETILKFKREVDTVLPGCYEWISESALHVTIASLHFNYC